MALGRLNGKVAWISGGNSGIGAATAQLFAEEGAAVAVVARRIEQCREVAEKIVDNGGRALALSCDAADENAVRESIARTAKEFGGLDILVNNAGMVDIRPLHESSLEQWENVMGVNVRSMFLALKYGWPHLQKNARSYVVNVGSISSFVGQAGTPVYTTSKHAVLGLTRSIALDYAAFGLRCNCVCPGITDTPMLREHLSAHGDADEALRERLKRVPMAVSLTPRDVAKSILFFSCEDSSGVTGTSLTIDGGYLAAAEWNAPDHTAFME